MDELNPNTISGDDMANQAAEIIWGSVATASRAFEKVKVKIDPTSRRIFLAISLRWWAKHKRFEMFRKYWMAKAERKSKPFIPPGWKPLIYYQLEEK